MIPFIVPTVNFLNGPHYEVIEEDGTLQICFNVTRNNYQGFLNYTTIDGDLFAKGRCFVHTITPISTDIQCYYYSTAGVDFVPFSNSEFLSDQPNINRCVSLQVIDDTLLEDNELLIFRVTADRGLEFDAIILILDTIDSE